MKKTYKYLLTIAFNGLLCLFVAFSANAQHRDGGGGGGGSRSSGGGGGSSSGGGGGGSRPSSTSSSPPPSGGGGARPSYSGGGGARPSYSGGVGVARPSFNGGGGGARPSYNGGGSYGPLGSNSRVAIAPSRVNQGIRPSSYNVAPGYRAGVNPGSYSYGGRSNVNANARSYVGGRGYIGAGGRASVGVGGRGFYGPSYWRTHDYYHYYHGYYNTYYWPRIGFSIGFLPYGYYPFYYGDYEYYYSDGLYYQYDNNQYTVVEPPVGAEITTLPDKAQSIVINGQQYYELNGVYYLPITKDDGTLSYEIAGKDGELNTNTANDTQQAPIIGDIVENLPPDCRKINLNGEKYYVSPDGYYYQETRDANNNKVYKIVGTPDDVPQN
jgi:hypothetical protein